MFFSIKQRYRVNNPFRKAFEFYSVFSIMILMLFAYFNSGYFFFSIIVQNSFLGFSSMLLLVRLFQGTKVKAYHHQLQRLKKYTLNINQSCQIKDKLFIGKGFRWNVKHTDLAYRLNLPEYAHLKKRPFHLALSDSYRGKKTNRLSNYLGQSKYNLLKPLPPVGGEPALHGLDNKEENVGISESERTGHIMIKGTTRVGKTRLLCLLIAQEILRNKSVIVVDPKGDLDLLRSMYSVCKKANKLNDFQVVHLGYPSVSARLNTLSNFVEVIDVAGRITASLSEEGDSDAFTNFAWRFLNIGARTLEAIDERINYKLINFFLLKPEALLMRYVVKIYPELLEAAEELIEDDFNKQLNNEKTKNQAARKDLQWAIIKVATDIQQKTMQGNNLHTILDSLLYDLLDLVNLDNYQKLAQSAKPTLEMLSTGRSAEIFSFFDNAPIQGEVVLSDVIKQNSIVYIGLNSMGNKKVAEATGQAILADLISSCAGKTYLLGEVNRSALYFDEVSEIMSEDLARALNKAGGSGFQITIAMQTDQDSEKALGSKAAAKIVEGNTQSEIVMRVKNKETAESFTDKLREVYVTTVSEDSTATDTPYAEDEIFYKSSNRTSLKAEKAEVISPSDIIALPKGQGFMLTNGNELYKVRIPQPQGEEDITNDMEELIRDINENFVYSRKKLKEKQLEKEQKPEEKKKNEGEKIRSKEIDILN